MNAILKRRPIHRMQFKSNIATTTNADDDFSFIHSSAAVWRLYAFSPSLHLSLCVCVCTERRALVVVFLFSEWDAHCSCSGSRSVTTIIIIYLFIYIHNIHWFRFHHLMLVQQPREEKKTPIIMPYRVQSKMIQLRVHN